jgi:CRISPR system Cascade subunit CasD
MHALIFVVAAPLMSFGEIAVDERRGTAPRPTRSAILGVIAAALGWDRADARQQALSDGYDVAMRVDRPGRLLADYHTVQAPPTSAVRRRAGGRPATRAEELAVGDLGTKLTRRDYLVDAAFTVMVVARPSAPASLDAVAAALERPRWRLSAGRRACPLGLPPAPRLVDAPTVAAAFAAYDLAEDDAGEVWPRAQRGNREDPEKARRLLRRLFGIGCDRQAAVAADIGLEAELGFAATRREMRRDLAADRMRWQFARRVELVGRLAGGRG